ncbi:MAG TPA: hypothetical protein VL523_06575 [Terriglobia bacterium]|nr:hypothetical protein [Terriglobia bacterium]
MSSDHATFTILEESPEEVAADNIRDEVAQALEPYKLYQVRPFDHDGPFPGKLEVIWFPRHKHIALCWDPEADVTRLIEARKWWGGEEEEADVRCLTDGIEEYLNEHDRFAAEQNYRHAEPHLRRAT